MKLDKVRAFEKLFMFSGTYLFINKKLKGFDNVLNYFIENGYITEKESYESIERVMRRIYHSVGYTKREQEKIKNYVDNRLFELLMINYKEYNTENLGDLYFIEENLFRIIKIVQLLLFVFDEPKINFILKTIKEITPYNDHGDFSMFVKGKLTTYRNSYATPDEKLACDFIDNFLINNWNDYAKSTLISSKLFKDDQI